tara:strand:- start:1198 stop:1797 length:600 start_codon:yes stop_codon:yes gene_type:complete
MAITINGSSNTISGLAAGGLPDGSIQAADFASGVGGKILQVVSCTKTDTFSTTDDTVNVTGTDQAGSGSVWCVKITPAATSSKIFVQVMLTAHHENHHGGIWLYRDSTAIAQSTDSSGQQATTKVGINSGTSGGGEHVFTTIPILFLDSPSSTSELTYKVMVGDHGEGGTTYINRAHSATSWAGSWRGVSTITVMEIGA